MLTYLVHYWRNTRPTTDAHPSDRISAGICRRCSSTRDSTARAYLAWSAVRNESAAFGMPSLTLTGWVQIFHWLLHILTWGVSIKNRFCWFFKSFWRALIFLIITNCLWKYIIFGKVVVQKTCETKTKWSYSVFE